MFGYFSILGNGFYLLIFAHCPLKSNWNNFTQYDFSMPAQFISSVKKCLPNAFHSSFIDIYSGISETCRPSWSSTDRCLWQRTENEVRLSMHLRTIRIDTLQLANCPRIQLYFAISSILIAAGVFIVFGSMMECEGTVDDPDQKIPSFQKPQLLYQI